MLLTFCFVLVGAAPPISIIDYSNDFDRFEEQTRGKPDATRVSAFHAFFDKRRPGLYVDGDRSRLDRRIAKSLAEFPALRTRYRLTAARFPAALADATVRFRRYFSDFAPPIPIILMHSLGTRDGGSDYVGGRKVMIFGADMIARVHGDDSMQPFIEHELFHLEHGRHFDDCDQMWCPLWQEGLATYAASAMTPGASDRQLLLDQPAPIRASTDEHWNVALCTMARDFDAADQSKIGEAFLGNRHPPGLPARYGYYLGLRVAERAARTHGLSALARLNNAEARPVVARALGQLIADAHAPCAGPSLKGRVTHVAPRSA